MNNGPSGKEYDRHLDELLMRNPHIKRMAEIMHKQSQAAAPKLSLEDVHTLQLQAVETNDKEWFDQLAELKATTV